MIETYEEVKKRTADETQVDEYLVGRQGWDWLMVGAIAGLAGGIMVVVIGSLLTAGSWLTGGGSSYIRTLGTIFLIMTIPLLVCGAHCLDLMEKRKDQAREIRFHDKS
ncbi:MAG TPA: hypothetical protein VGC91_15800 [Pyrinomonadaceae bacterium]